MKKENMTLNSQKAIIVPTWTVCIHPQAELELQKQAPDLQARFVHIAQLLETFGPQQVGMPHIRPLQGKLWEMRMMGRDGIARAIYVALENRRLLVLHVFVKKTASTPRQALLTARKRWESC